MSRSGCSTTRARAPSAQAIGIAERLGVPFRRIPLSLELDGARRRRWRRHGSLIGLSRAAGAAGGRARGRPRGPLRAGAAQRRRRARAGDLLRAALGGGGAVAEGALRLPARALHAAGARRVPALERLRPAGHPGARPAAAGARTCCRCSARRTASRRWRCARRRRRGASGCRICRIRAWRCWWAAARAGRRCRRRWRMRSAGGSRGWSASARGSVLATTSRDTGAEATDALAAGLGRTLHLLYRWGEPGENPYVGFLATRRRDRGHRRLDVSMISARPAPPTAPVFVALPELAGAAAAPAARGADGRRGRCGGSATISRPGRARRSTRPAGSRARSCGASRWIDGGAGAWRGCGKVATGGRHGESGQGPRHRIAVIPGDGIGKETTPEGLRVLDAAARRFGFALELTHYDWSCETWKQTGAMMPADGLDRLRESDGIFLGAVGWPGVPDHVSLWGLLIPIRRGFDQYANVRPCRLMPGAEDAAGRARPRPTSTSTSCGRTPRASTAAAAGACSRAPSASSSASRACSRAPASTASCATRSSWR